MEEIEFKTRFERHAWETFKRFHDALIEHHKCADTMNTDQLAATLTVAALINALDCEVGNVVDVLAERNRQL